jgi:hypothetical protein
VRIEAAVLVDHHEPRPASLFRRRGEQPVHHRIANLVGEGRDGETGIVLRHRLGCGVAVLQQAQHRGGGGRPAHERGELFHEGAAVHAAMREAVIEVDGGLRDGGRGVVRHVVIPLLASPR